ncbi:glycerol-3-phosphate dehydrogenase, putative [Hepatocystis sp. ex Piliocolobus tephrosceles]|uniref:Glycerol-3-phosphate dehydrogenase [NAD(+)] n=1 Tax=Piliocolobus tephrosceles TaxID=591936 RepID=A0A8C9LJQ7_9PRIM|nr:glycerol-3-phosphate dehydrogenase, putative [Hepatocystis sp. ex Piliocolobus tephrosceles]
MLKNLFDKLKECPLKIGILGSGNWATTISKVVGTNAQNNEIFENEVKMWVRDEPFENAKLSDIINTKHENMKYLKGVKLPTNVVAYSNVSEVVNNSDLLIFVIPSQYLENILQIIKQNESVKIKKDAKAISLIKGFIVKDDTISICSKYITDILDIPCCALSGANIASEIAHEKFAEATIGGNNKEELIIWQRAFDLPYFKINCVNDSAGAEICGALKNIITLAVGFCNGLNVSTNSKSAIIRNGIKEMILFAKIFFNYDNINILLESCGFADIITSFLSGRNTKCAVEFVKPSSNKSWQQIEDEILNGQKIQGIVTLKYVYKMISEKNLTHKFPLFTVINKISWENENPEALLKTFMIDDIIPIDF